MQMVERSRKENGKSEYKCIECLQVSVTKIILCFDCSRSIVLDYSTFSRLNLFVRIFNDKGELF